MVNISHTQDKKRIYKRIILLSISLTLLLSIFTGIQTFAGNGLRLKNISWDTPLTISEQNGIQDTLIFGEAPDANDGTPPDHYDVPKPPLYLPPYIRAWFTNNLSAPYDFLAQDYRSYPDHEKTWDLYIQWTPADYTSPTNVTIQWNLTQLHQSEYHHIMLCTTDHTPIQDMLLINQYSFTCEAMIPQHYIIHATKTTYKLNISQQGQGDITLIPNQPSYYPGIHVLIQAIPNPNWLFKYWTGDISSPNPTQQITMDSNKKIEAHFILNDTTPPLIKINHPQPGLYIHNTIFHRFILNRKTIIIGSIQLQISAEDSQTKITNLSLFIDNKNVYQIEGAYLNYTWVEKRLHLFNHRHTIRIIAVDENGNKAMKEFKVIKF